MYPIHYLRSKTTTRVLNPGPTVKLVGIMAQDSMPKKKKKRGKKSSIQKEKNRSTCYQKLEAVLKRKKHKYRSMSQKIS